MSFLLRGVGIRPLGALLRQELRVSNRSAPFKRAFNKVRFNSTSATPTEAPVGLLAKGLTPEEIKLARELTWEQFLTLRRLQRRSSVGGSVAGAILAMAGSWVYVSQRNIDPTATIFGLDEITVYIGAIMCMGMMGYVAGAPLLGDPFFMLTHRGIAKAYSVKQKLFLKHIAKMRPDASRQSVNNPVPDYYGEKIGSLKDYRQWLRDCNEYRRKASEFL